MTKLFIDTNIVIDLLAKREPYYESSAKLFSMADNKIVELSVSSLTIANTNYILSKLTSLTQAKELLRRLRVLVEIIPLSEKEIDLSLNDSGFQDFEDALQYFSALNGNQDGIITRNLKDFKHSQLPVMTAGEFIIAFRGNGK